MKKYNFYLFLVSLCLVLSGCGSFGKKLKSFLGGEESAPSASQPKGMKKFSENSNVTPNRGERLYRRVNKEIFEKEGVLDDRAGSLWAMEGQTSYLFAANTNRLSGDIINIDLEGSPRSQLEKKVEIIKSLLDKNRKAQRAMAATPAAASGTPEAEKKAATPDPKVKTASTSPDNSTDKQEEAEEKASPFDVSKIPSRIIEQSTDGSYRIKGSQTFMIGKREYKVIATGLVRPTDVKDDTVQASRILDSRFDIVSMKKEIK